jgi:hypothetical protein
MAEVKEMYIRASRGYEKALFLPERFSIEHELRRLIFPKRFVLLINIPGSSESTSLIATI